MRIKLAFERKRKDLFMICGDLHVDDLWSAIDVYEKVGRMEDADDLEDRADLLFIGISSENTRKETFQSSQNFVTLRFLTL